MAVDYQMTTAPSVRRAISFQTVRRAVKHDRGRASSARKWAEIGKALLQQAFTVTNAVVVVVPAQIEIVQIQGVLEIRPLHFFVVVVFLLFVLLLLFLLLVVGLYRLDLRHSRRRRHHHGGPPSPETFFLAHSFGDESGQAQVVIPRIESIPVGAVALGAAVPAGSLQKLHGLLLVVMVFLQLAGMESLHEK